MTICIIKIIACITMILDHIRYAVPVTNIFVTRFLGRISFPLFAFLLTEGYVHTKNLKNYYKRLFIFAIISQIPFMLFRKLVVGEWKMLNIMFTLLLGLIAITIFDKEKRKYISIPCVILTIFLGKILKVDYGWYGVATIILFYLLKEHKYLIPLSYLLLLIIYYYDIIGSLNFNTNTILNIIASWISTFIIILYNGKEGKKIKYFYYIFYPVHLLIFYFIAC